MVTVAAKAPPTRRSKTTTVRLDDLRPQLDAAAAEAGVGPSTWVRELVRRELESRAPTVASPARADSERSAVYRAWLDADLTAQLDRRRQRDGFRSRAAVLRALIRGVGITGEGNASTARVAAVPGAPDGLAERSVSLREAVDVLGASNHELVAAGRNLNQIARAMREGERSDRIIDKLRLEQAVEVVYSHVLAAAQLLGSLRPLMKQAPGS